MKNIKKLFIFMMCMLMAFTSSICANEVKASTYDVDQKFDNEWTYVGDTPETGIMLNILPYILSLAGAVSGFAIFTVLKRKKEEA